MLDTDFEGRMEAWRVANHLAGSRTSRDTYYRAMLRRGALRLLLLRRSRDLDEVLRGVEGASTVVWSPKGAIGTPMVVLPSYLLTDEEEPNE